MLIKENRNYVILEAFDMTAIIRIVIDRSEVRIDAPTKEQLFKENESFESFAQSVIETIEKGDIYDDSDGELKVYYVAAKCVKIDESIGKFKPYERLRGRIES